MWGAGGRRGGCWGSAARCMKDGGTTAAACCSSNAACTRSAPSSEPTHRPRPRPLTYVQLRRAGALWPCQLNHPGAQVLILHQAASIGGVLQPVAHFALRGGRGAGLSGQCTPPPPPPPWTCVQAPERDMQESQCSPRACIRRCATALGARVPPVAMSPVATSPFPRRLDQPWWFTGSAECRQC